jgi:hypothetical protein
VLDFNWQIPIGKAARSCFEVASKEPINRSANIFSEARMKKRQIFYLATAGPVIEPYDPLCDNPLLMQENLLVRANEA